jgi:hypothetical protein
MAETRVTVDGRELVYDSKKEMLKDVGRRILAGSDDPMTLRQLYYRFVALDILENKESQYSYLGEAVKEARIEGRIPWHWVEDRTRSADAGDHDKTDPRDHFERWLDAFRNCDQRFHRPRWEDQPRYVEVWVEKEALAGVFASVAEDLKVVSFPNRGYTSVTLLHDAAVRFREATEERDLEAPPTILYFGDFDPSGQDIERNIRDKLNDTFGVPVEVERVALTRAQIEERRLPPQPAKRTDARYETFVEEHGDLAVELDALPPEDLRGMVRDAVSERFDEDVHARVKRAQAEDRGRIRERVSGVLDE